MAKIYLQPTGNDLGDKGLILEPREALVYPFDFGDDWKTLAMGMYFSYCGISGDLSPWSTEIVNESTVSSFLNNNFYFGFTNADAPFPTDKNNYYCGTYCAAGFTNEFTLSNVSNSPSLPPLRLSTFISGRRSTNLTLSNSLAGVVFPTATSATLETGYGRFLGLRISSSFSDQNSFSKMMSGSSSSDTSIASTPPIYTISNLQKDVINRNYTFLTVGNNIFWTYDGTSGSPILPRPNAILIYSPFISNRLRIHSLLVSRID